jgi:hypothetical protein
LHPHVPSPPDDWNEHVFAPHVSPIGIVSPGESATIPLHVITQHAWLSHPATSGAASLAASESAAASIAPAGDDELLLLHPLASPLPATPHAIATAQRASPLVIRITSPPRLSALNAHARLLGALLRGELDDGGVFVGDVGAAPRMRTQPA